MKTKNHDHQVVLVESFLLTKSDAQTEDGHAIMKLSTFHSFQTLSHAGRGCHKNCQQVRANLKAYMCVSQETSRGGES